MARQVKANAVEVADLYDWSRVEHVVDVGGGTGEMLRTILGAPPHLRGTLFDLPRVVAVAEPAERVYTVGGDFFDDALPGGDAYVLSQILHGFPDDDAGRILGRCAEAGGADARILLVEEVITERPTAGEGAPTSSCLRSAVGASGRSTSSVRSPDRRPDAPVGAAPDDGQLAIQPRL